MATRANGADAPLRRGLLGLGALTTVGITLELITERHWTRPAQWIAWGALALMALALALLWRRPSARRVRVARALAVLVVASAAVGVWRHVAANHDAGPLDYRYARTWAGLSPLVRWWLAARKGVGPAPPLAPGALAQAGLCALLATARHPALGAERAAPAETPG